MNYQRSLREAVAARKERRLADQVYTSSYLKVDSGHCTYCGAASDCFDHVPSLSWVSSLGTAYFMEKDTPLLLVSACNECNLILGSVGLFDMDERLAYVAGELRCRYRKVIGIPGPLSEVVLLRIAFADQSYSPPSFDVSEPQDTHGGNDEGELERKYMGGPIEVGDPVTPKIRAKYRKKSSVVFDTLYAAQLAKQKQ